MNVNRNKYLSYLIHLGLDDRYQWSTDSDSRAANKGGQGERFLWPSCYRVVHDVPAVIKMFTKKCISLKGTYVRKMYRTYVEEREREKSII